MEKVFFICEDATGECASFSTKGFTAEELEAIVKFGRALSEHIGLSIRVGTEDEFYE